MRSAFWSGFVVVFGLLALTFGSGAFAAEDEEETVPLDKLPKAVVDAVKKMFPKAEMTGATKEEEENDDEEDDGDEKEGEEKDDDKDDAKGNDKDDAKGDDKDDDDEKPEIIYEVTLKDNGQEINVTVEESGEIEEVERAIDLKDLPKLVTDALARKFPKSTLKSAEAIYEVEDGEEEFECYEVKLETADKKEIEAEVEIEVEISVDDE
ncbi:MAG: PepSY-like domain-containing protein [Fuerstia sp.]|nr:PepSY-like domain-containing protein [Fuerstiella sp.]